MVRHTIKKEQLQSNKNYILLNNDTTKHNNIRNRETIEEIKNKTTKRYFKGGNITTKTQTFINARNVLFI